MNAPLLELRDVCKSFGGKPVLHHVNLRVERGETVVVVGGSGCGKTTLARLLIGLDVPTSGAVLLDGVNLAELTDAELTEARARFSMVFQRAGLLDSLNVFDNVAFPLRERGHLGEEDIRARVLRALGELGMEQAVDRLPGELSGGMAKRVGIARALVVAPEIIVYDEPTSGLDPVSSRTVDALIEHTRERFLVSSLVITHDMISAFQIADRVLLLAKGRIVAEENAASLQHTTSAELRDFAISSGVDLERLVRINARKSAESIRQEWAASRKPTSVERAPERGAETAEPTTVPPFLVLYATREGHTHKVAAHVADCLRAHGHVVDLVDARQPPARIVPGAYRAAILAASVHMGHHQREIVAFAREHRAVLETMPTAFLSVSLSEAGVEHPSTLVQRASSEAEVRGAIESFVAETGWHPGRVMPVAGALLYREYGLLKRWMLHFVVKRSVGATDTSQNYEYTDWEALHRFIAEMAEQLPA